jgi:hypothetical protein
MSFRNRPPQTVQLRFIHLPAAFITLLAALIPFSFSMVGGGYRVPHHSGVRLYRLSRQNNGKVRTYKRVAAYACLRGR